MSHARKRLKRPRRRFVLCDDYGAGLGDDMWDWAVYDTSKPDTDLPVAVFVRKRDAQEWARLRNKTADHARAGRGRP